MASIESVAASCFQLKARTKSQSPFPAEGFARLAISAKLRWDGVHDERQMCGATTPAQTTGAASCHVFEPMTDPKSPMKSHMESAVKLYCRFTYESICLVDVA